MDNSQNASGSSLEFRAYPSIENSYRKPFLDLVRENESGDLWCVTEKVHGANLSFITDGDGIKMAKRSAIIHEKDHANFFHSDIVFKKMRSKIISLYNSWGGDGPIIVYGEIFGGYYPTATQHYKHVQKGVYYTSEVEFYAFDIYLLGLGKFMDYDNTIELFQENGILHAPILFMDCLDGCLEWSSRFKDNDSTIPTLLGNDHIKHNMREGHVIKPIKAGFLNKGSRAIVKDKNEKFLESPLRNKKTETPVDQAVFMLINRQRYANVISKMGLVTPVDIPQIIEYFMLDISEEWEKDNPCLSLDQKKVIKSKIGKFAVKTMRKDEIINKRVASILTHRVAPPHLSL